MSPRPPQQLAVHLWKHSEALEALETGIRGSRRLENLCRDFELQKVCYLPLNTFLLRPLHRLVHYKRLLERLCKHHPPNHADFRDCRGERGAGRRAPRGTREVEGRARSHTAGEQMARSPDPDPIFLTILC